jgi:branched-chain amino acid transport system substrate-binding protein
MTLLVKAAKDAGLNVNFYTYYGGGLGSVAAMGESAIGKVKQITEWHANVPTKDTDRMVNEFKKKNPDLDYYYGRAGTLMFMLAQAVKQAKSTEPNVVAKALSGMKMETELGQVEMRASDHQMIQPLYISTLQKQASKGGPKEVKYDADNSGLGFATDARIEAYVSAQPTSCNMKKP